MRRMENNNPIVQRLSDPALLQEMLALKEHLMALVEGVARRRGEAQPTDRLDFRAELSEVDRIMERGREIEQEVRARMERS